MQKQQNDTYRFTENYAPLLVYFKEFDHKFRTAILKIYISMTASEDNYFLRSFLNDCFSKAAKVVITWFRLNRWKSVLFYRDPGIVINSSKIISCDYVWKVSSWQSRIFHFHCRDLPLPGGNFHVIASTCLNGMKRLIQFVKTHFFLFMNEFFDFRLYFFVSSD